MKKTIWKFEFAIDDNILIEMPEGAEILSVQIQKGIPCIWALVNPLAKKTERQFELYGTGHEMECNDLSIGHEMEFNENLERKFIETFQMINGNVVFHLFERLNIV